MSILKSIFPWLDDKDDEWEIEEEINNLEEEEDY